MDDLLIICGLIILNGIFSMSEVALISARKSKLSSEAKSGNRNASVALQLANEPERFLSTVQIGITLIGILTGLFSGATIANELGTLLVGWGVKESFALPCAKIVIVSVVTYLSIVVGELVPKRIGMNMSDTIAKSVAPAMRMLSIVAYPFVWLLSVSTTAIARLLHIDRNSSKVTEEEIKSLIKEGTQTGEVQEVEQDIMERAFLLGDLKVESVMTVRSDVICLRSGMSADDVKEILERELHSSYPVHNTDKSEIIGVISLKQLIFSICDDNFDLTGMLTPGIYVPENIKVYDVLEMFKQSKIHSALVCDEYGDFCGIITLRDILDGLVGSVSAYPEEEMIVKRPDKDEWLIDGRCSVYDFLANFDCEDLYTPESYTTMGGLIMNHLKRVPATGDTIQWNGFRIEVIDMDYVRVDKLGVQLLKAPSHKN